MDISTSHRLAVATTNAQRHALAQDGRACPKSDQALRPGTAQLVVHRQPAGRRAGRGSRCLTNGAPLAESDRPELGATPSQVYGLLTPAEN